MRFFVLVFCTDRPHIGQIIRLSNVFVFVLEFTDLVDFFNIRGDSVDTESHSPSTESTPTETPCQLSQCEVRLHVNWVNMEWWNLCKCWCLLRWLSWCWVSLRVDSVDMTSHSTLTQLTGVSLCIDTVCRRLIKPKWGQYQPENAKSFYVAWSKKLTPR
jgi:hypothetical protein